MKPVSITVNGKKVEGFNSDVHIYRYLFPAVAIGAPTVAAASSGSHITVEGYRPRIFRGLHSLP